MLIYRMSWVRIQMVFVRDRQTTKDTNYAKNKTTHCFVDFEYFVVSVALASAPGIVGSGQRGGLVNPQR